MIGARQAIKTLYRADEAACVDKLGAEAQLTPAQTLQIEHRARRLVEAVRAERKRAGGVDIFLQEYALDTDEGVVLMCLAEALLRIPDEETQNLLVRDKIGGAEWERHLGQSSSLFVNASTWGLMLTGRLFRLGEGKPPGGRSLLQALIARTGEPVVRQALHHAMRIMGRQFVMGRTIKEARTRANEAEAKGYLHSYDMLGEAAHTAEDAERYFDAYQAAITAIGAGNHDLPVTQRASISIKLSALHPRYEFAQAARVRGELLPRLQALARAAKENQVGLTLDAEEADRLEPSLDLFEALYLSDAAADWAGLGLAVQAYQKRAPAVIDWLAMLGKQGGRRIPVRLVKGAYWDTEIKRGQEQGLDGYPVYTRKAATDVCYIVCAKKLIAAADALYPQFATHNARTIATIEALADGGYEFQRLHGMGEALYDAVAGDAEQLRVPCRIYAPVGSHEDLLPYLVRRLLENGANTSFVNRLADDAAPIDDVIADPLANLVPYAPHPRIPLPADLYGDARRNSKGLDLADEAVTAPLLEAMAAHAAKGAWRAAPIINGEETGQPGAPVRDPANHTRVVGLSRDASLEEVDRAAIAAGNASHAWSMTGADERAACLERFADLLEERHAEALALCVREAGKTIPDALAEVREAVDFARYYAMRTGLEFAHRRALPGPTGEHNSIGLAGRGVFTCISPWNFPLAIFCGQVLAALAAGNAVLAKPAEQTPLIAAFAVRLMHEAGIPPGVLHLLPGGGETVGAALVRHPATAGVAFTGSTVAAQHIARALAARDGAILPLIAETGGQNAMIVDSSALTEQVVSDVVGSAFLSAGQRCSCLRVLFLQQDIAPRVIGMLAGAMEELALGDPMELATDVGPVIDAEALAHLEQHAKRMATVGTPQGIAPAGKGTGEGNFFRPRAFEIDGIDQLEGEVFGPILHVVRYAADHLDSVVDAVNATRFGLTLGVHSRIDSTIEQITRRARVGNIYVNRNMVGAVVGVQPFGGEGLSGTGPKAGGPRYLHRFATERTISIDTTAAGGNAQLLSLGEGQRSSTP